MRAPQESQSRMPRRQFLAKAGALLGLGLAASACKLPLVGGGDGKSSTSAGATPAKESSDGSNAWKKGFVSAEQNSGQWKLTNPDGGKIDVALPEGFTPDARLVIPSDLPVNPINQDLSIYSDWEKALNTGRPVGDRLAGYNYDYNDFCPTADDKCNVQGDMYAWRVLQGQEVEIPGIGKLVGGERKSVVALFINLEPSVVAWDEQDGGLGQVRVERGFTATGRIFDGNKLQKTEENLAGHWLFRQAKGTPEKSYIGITDSPDNARETLFVTVARRQWGNNPDGSKRIQFQLMRAENVPFGK